MQPYDKPVDPSELEALRDLEESLWRTATRYERTLMDKIFADDFFEFGRSGRTYAREQLLFDPAEKRELNATLPLANFRVRHLSDDVVQITYMSEVAHDGVTERANRSSIWSRTADGWRLRFHQGTPAP